MTGTVDGPNRVVIWVTERTWQASVDAARRLAPAGSSVTLLHVTPEEPPDTAHAAYLGLFGRGRPGRDPGPRIADISAASAAEVIDAAARRLGRPCERIMRSGRTEREVVTVAAGADLLIMARDGDRSRLAPGASARPPVSPSTTPPARSCWSGQMAPRASPRSRRPLAGTTGRTRTHSRC